MFENVLVAEDHEIMNLSLRRTLEELQIPLTDFAHHCNQALSKLKRGLQIGKPFDLLVTDLYFEVEASAEQLFEGAELIKSAKLVQPGLKVLVFSAESRPSVIRTLFDDLHIDGYVRKARGDAKDLKDALERIKNGLKYLPRELRNQSPAENLHSFTDFDKTIIRLLVDGKSQIEISAYLSSKNIHPSSLSSVEKRLNFIKTSMGFKKNEQLIAFCKDLGII